MSVALNGNFSHICVLQLQCKGTHSPVTPYSPDCCNFPATLHYNTNAWILRGQSKERYRHQHGGHMRVALRSIVMMAEIMSVTTLCSLSVKIHGTPYLLSTELWPCMHLLMVCFPFFHRLRPVRCVGPNCAWVSAFALALATALDGSLFSIGHFPQLPSWPMS